MGVLRFKDGVTLTPDVAGARLLGSIERVVRTWPTDMVVTCGSDSHPPTDPHTHGRAFDLRTHGLTDDQKKTLLTEVLADLREPDLDPPVEMPIAGIWFAANTRFWFGQIENHLADDEHLHVQLRNAAVFPLPTSPQPTKAA